LSCPAFEFLHDHLNGPSTFRPLFLGTEHRGIKSKKKRAWIE